MKQTWLSMVKNMFAHKWKKRGAKKEAYEKCERSTNRTIKTCPKWYICKQSSKQIQQQKRDQHKSQKKQEWRQMNKSLKSTQKLKLVKVLKGNTSVIEMWKKTINKCKIQSTTKTILSEFEEDMKMNTNESKPKQSQKRSAL